MANYRKQMGALITGQMLSLLLGFMLPLILVRILSKHDYGLYAQFNVILSFCTTFFNFGFSSELYFSYPTAQEKEKRILVFQSFLMLMIAGIIASIILYIPIVKNYIISQGNFEELYFYLTCAVLVSVPEILITALYVLNHDNKTSAFFLPIMTLFRVCLIFIFYKIDPSIKSVFSAILISSIVKFLYVVGYTTTLIKKNKGEQLINKKILVSQIKYSIPLGFASSTRILIQQLDKLIILSFVSPSVYAIYSIAFYGVPGLAQVYLSISQVYIPRMATAYKENNLAGVVSLYHSMVSKTLSYTIPIILIIMLFADPIIPFIFSNKYTDSVPYFQIYLLTFIIQSIGCGNILRATGETRRSLMAYIYTAIIMFPLTYFAIKYYYLHGAIVAATIGAILPKILLSIYDAHSIKASILAIYPWKNIFTIFAISLICLLPFIGVFYWIGHENFWMTLVWISLYLGITFSLQIYFNVFILNYSEIRAYIRKIIKK